MNIYPVSALLHKYKCIDRYKHIPYLSKRGKIGKLLEKMCSLLMTQPFLVEFSRVAQDNHNVKMF